MTPPKPDPALLEKLAIANRILYDQNVVDGFGHVSVRHDKSPEHFLLSCNRAPGLVSPEDILTYDLNGDLAVASDKRSYLERFIHSEIYRARPDVMSVVHSHSQSVIPFGATGQRLRPIFHMSGFLGSGSALFEIRDAGGNTDLLIRDTGLGKALAQSLGKHNCVLMRGHGSTTVAPSLELAVYRAIYAEVNAKLQIQAAALGPVNFLNEEEAALAAASTEGQVVRAWDLWRGRIGSIA
ncbi:MULTISPECIES: class II aldolase/adducin family protein [Polaromonas]|uniref:Class II aldolase/adducin family protein n=1 Tax=Polaromonas aquatica TaxID=332657 RepID=A0ABW1U5A7_9BURK